MTTTKMCRKCGQIKTNKVCERCGGREFVDALSDDQIMQILNHKNVAGGCLSVVVYLFLFTVAVLSMLVLPPLGIVLLVVLLVRLFAKAGKKRDKNQVLVEQLLNAPMFDLFYMPEFIPDGKFSPDTFRQSGLFTGEWEFVEGSNMLKGERAGITFEMGNYSLSKKVKNSAGDLVNETVYEGYLVVCKLSRSIYDQILIMPKASSNAAGFDAKYQVSASNPVIRDNTLTEQVKDALFDFSSKTGSLCIFSIKGDQLYAAALNQKIDYFEGETVEEMRNAAWRVLHRQSEWIDSLANGGELLETSDAKIDSGVHFAE